MINQHRFFLLSFIMMIMCIESAYSISIGVSPSRVSFENVLGGGYAERTVSISTNSPENLSAAIKLSGELSEWVRFEPDSKIITMSESKPYKLKIIVEPPEDARLDKYSGSITFTTESLGDVSTRAGGMIRAAVTLSLGLDITGDVITECRAGGFTFSDIEYGYPFEVGSVVINDGNSRIKPELSFDIWDQAQENILLSRKIILDEILPTAQERMARTIANDMEVGQYWVSMEISECKASDFITFSIFEKGGVADNGILQQVTNKQWVYVNEPVKISARFKNTGQRKVFARFNGQITLDDIVVHTIKTDELDVGVGETVDFESYFTPEKPGRYIISGRVKYNKKLSFEKGSIMNVNYPPEGVKVQKAWLVLLIYFMIIITILFLIRKIIVGKKRQRH